MASIGHALPTASPSAFATGSGDSLPTHSVFLDAGFDPVTPEKNAGGGSRVHDVVEHEQRGARRPEYGAPLTHQQEQEQLAKEAARRYAQQQQAQQDVDTGNATKSWDMPLPTQQAQQRVDPSVVTKSWDMPFPAQQHGRQAAQQDALRWSHEGVFSPAAQDISACQPERRVQPQPPAAPHDTIRLPQPPTFTTDGGQAVRKEHRPPASDPFDEVPIQASTKSFDQLLSQALQAEGENAPVSGNRSRPAPAKKSEKKTRKFLKRGARNWYKPPPPAKKPPKKPQEQRRARPSQSQRDSPVDEFTMPPPPPQSPPESAEFDLAPVHNPGRALAPDRASASRSPGWVDKGNGRRRSDEEILDEFTTFEEDIVRADKDDSPQPESSARNGKESAFLSLINNSNDDIEGGEEESWGELPAEEGVFPAAQPPPTALFSGQQGGQTEPEDDEEFDSVDEEDDTDEERGRRQPSASLSGLRIKKSGKRGDQRRKKSPLIQKRFSGQRRENKIKKNINAVRHEKAETHIPDHVLERIKRLEQENEALKAEVDKVKKQRKMMERTVSSLRKERAELERFTVEEKERMQEWKRKEEKRIKAERRVLERQARAQYQVPNRKDRAEIDALKATVTKLKLDVQKKDSKNRLNQKRLKDRNSQLNSQIEELEEELRYAQEQVLSNRWDDEKLKSRNGNGGTSSGGARAAPRQPANTNERNSFGSAKRLDSTSNQTQLEFSLKGGPQNDNGSDSQSFNGWEDNMPVQTSAEKRPQPDSSSYAFPDDEQTADTHGHKNEMFGRDGDAFSDSEDYPELGHSVHSNLRGSHEASRRIASSPVNASPNPKHTTRNYNPKLYKGPGKAETDERKRTEKPKSRIPVASRTKKGLVTRKFKQRAGGRDEEEDAEVIEYADGKREKRFPDGRRYIWFRNGTEKEVKPDGSSCVKFANGDTKKLDSKTGTIVYFYSTAKTTHTTFADGLEVFEFPNQQKEKHFPDGSKEIEFTDGTRKYIYPDGQQLSIFPDGTQMMESSDGKKKVL